MYHQLQKASHEERPERASRGARGLQGLALKCAYVVHSLWEASTVLNLHELSIPFRIKQPQGLPSALVRLGKEAKNIQVIADVYWAILYVNIWIQFIYDTNETENCCLSQV